MKFVIEGQEQKQEPTLEMRQQLNEAGNVVWEGRRLNGPGTPWRTIAWVSRCGTVQMGMEFDIKTLGLTKA